MEDECDMAHSLLPPPSPLAQSAKVPGGGGLHLAALIAHKASLSGLPARTRTQ